MDNELDPSRYGFSRNPNGKCFRFGINLLKKFFSRLIKRRVGPQYKFGIISKMFKIFGPQGPEKLMRSEQYAVNGDQRSGIKD